jgi:hypothetical protein
MLYHRHPPPPLPPSGQPTIWADQEETDSLLVLKPQLGRGHRAWKPHRAGHFTLNFFAFLIINQYSRNEPVKKNF